MRITGSLTAIESLEKLDGIKNGKSQEVKYLEKPYEVKNGKFEGV